MSSVRHRFAAGLACALFGCVHTLPPPPMPEPVLPDVPLPAPPASPNDGQVLLDTVNDPARVEEVTGHVEGADSRGRLLAGEVYRPVCSSTPCAANLSLGTHELRFSSLTDPAAGGVASVDAGPIPTAYRYAMGRRDGRATFVGLGSLALGVGAALSGIALDADGSMTSPTSGQPQSAELQSAGTAMIIGGVALAAVGVILLIAAGPEAQEGQGTQWKLPQ
jgi:hypothetical protein